MLRFTVFGEKNGIIGTPTPLVDKENTPLFIGDIVVVTKPNGENMTLPICLMVGCAEEIPSVAGCKSMDFTTPDGATVSGVDGKFTLTKVSDWSERNVEETSWGTSIMVNGTMAVEEV